MENKPQTRDSEKKPTAKSIKIDPVQPRIQEEEEEKLSQSVEEVEEKEEQPRKKEKKSSTK